MMEANPEKFQVITLNTPANQQKAQITLSNKVIVAEESVKLLGIHLDEHLDFGKQAKELCRKAAAQLNVL